MRASASHPASRARRARFFTDGRFTMLFISPHAHVGRRIERGDSSFSISLGIRKYLATSNRIRRDVRLSAAGSTSASRRSTLAIFRAFSPSSSVNTR